MENALNIFTLLENSRLRFQDICKGLNMTSIGTAKILNELVEEGYILKESSQTSEFFIEDYYYINPQKSEKIQTDIYNTDKKTKIKYIVSETNRIIDIIANKQERDNDINCMHLSTVNLSGKSLDILMKKINDINSFLQACEQPADGKKVSFLLLCTDRKDLNMNC